MKKYLYLSFFTFLAAGTFAQQILWATPTTASSTPRGMFCDNSGNVYTYGTVKNLWWHWSGFFTFADDSEGSFFNRYTSSGQLSNSKTWSQSFWVMNAVYDGASHVYIAGSFAGTQQVDGQTITSKGQEDGFVAKVDLSGAIQWIRSIGSSTADAAFGITLDKNKTHVLVTGGVGDSLFVNGSLITPAQQRSAFICCFDLTGQLQQHKLFDFLPTKNIGNYGYEIKTDAQGSYYLLHNREGKTWSGDTTNAPEEGTYICQLDQSLNITWSNLVINGSCYYGYDCHRLALGSDGRSFVPSYCSSKYGGTGRLSRYDALSGTPTWSYTNTDGAYHDGVVEGNNAFVIGTEGANPCPCPGAHGGYQVIKKFDNSNALIGETRIRDVRLSTITSNGQGTLYVWGFFRGKQAQVGPYTLTNENEESFKHFLVAVLDVNCSPVPLNNSAFQPFALETCPGNSFTLNGPSGYGFYKWNDGTLSANKSVSKSGTYWLEVRQPGGCTAQSMPVTINVAEPPVVEPLVAGYEKANGVYELEWDRSDKPVIKYKVYRATSSSTVITEELSSMSYRYTYRDSIAPDEAPVYYVTAVDTCGNESVAGTSHQVMKLSFADEGGVPTLRWNAYKGFPYSKFYIYRNTTPLSAFLVDSVDADQTSYVDFSADQDYYYQVMVRKNDMVRSFSDIIKGRSAGATGITTTESVRSLRIFPNPSSGNFKILIEDKAEIGLVRARVYNVMGQVMLEKELRVNENKLESELALGNPEKGLYFVEVTWAGRREVRQVMVN